jgi:branched-chain amino acid transport system substrate-binding protein
MEQNKSNSIKWIVGVIVVILVIVIGLSAFNKPKETGEIKVGVVASLTGVGAYFGEQFVSGLQMAVKEVNDKGGVNGQTIKLIIEDSKTDNTTALTVAKKLIDVDGVKIILGDSWNATTLTMVPYTNEKKVILISPNASLDAFTKDDYVFRLISRTADLVKPLAKYVIDSGAKTVAIARVSSLFTDEHSVDFTKEFERLGGSVIADEQFTSPGSDVRSELTKIKAKNPDVIFDIHNSGPSIGLMISQANQIGLKTKWISSWAAENGALLKAYPKEIEGIIYPFMYDEADSVASKTFADKVRAGGKDANFFVAAGYDILNVIAKVVEEVGSSNTDKLKKALTGIKDYDGVSGKFSFDQNGDVVRDIFIKTVKDGQFVRVN